MTFDYYEGLEALEKKNDKGGAVMSGDFTVAVVGGGKSRILRSLHSAELNANELIEKGVAFRIMLFFPSGVVRDVTDDYLGKKE